LQLDFGVRIGRRIEAQNVAQPHERQQRAPQPQDLGGLHEVEPLGNLFAPQPDQLQDIDLRNGEPLVAALDDQRGNNGERQRQGDLNGRALPWRRLDVDGPAELFNVRANDVHADAAATYVGDLLRRREAGVENQPRRFAVAHAAGLLGVDDAFFDGLLLQPGRVDAAAVVGDVDPHLACLVIGPQVNRAERRLAGGDASFGTLDAVIDRVANQVGQRIADRLEDRLVDVDFLAVHDDVALLAELGAQVADDAGEFAEDGADRLHAGSHDRLLELGRDLIEARGDGFDAEVGVGGQGLNELIASQHQLAGQVHEAIENADLHANAGFGAGRRVRAGGDGRGFDGYGWRGLSRCDYRRRFRRDRRGFNGRLVPRGNAIGRIAVFDAAVEACEDHVECNDVHLDVDAVRSFGVVDQLIQGVGGPEHDVDHRRGGGQLAIAHPAQDVLEAVGQFVDGRQAQEPGRALD
jgi:hypothetical protein